MNNENEHLRRQLVGAQRGWQSATDLVLTLLEEKASMRESIQRLEQERDALSRENDRLRSKLSPFLRFSKQFSALFARFSAIQQENQTLCARVTALSADLSDAQDQVQKLQEQLRRCADSADARSARGADPDSQSDVDLSRRLRDIVAKFPTILQSREEVSKFVEEVQGVLDEPAPTTVEQSHQDDDDELECPGGRSGGGGVLNISPEVSQDLGSEGGEGDSHFSMSDRRPEEEKHSEESAGEPDGQSNAALVAANKEEEEEEPTDGALEAQSSERGNAQEWEIDSEEEGEEIKASGIDPDRPPSAPAEVAKKSEGEHLKPPDPDPPSKDSLPDFDSDDIDFLIQGSDPPPKQDVGIDIELSRDSHSPTTSGSMPLPNFDGQEPSQDSGRRARDESGHTHIEQPSDTTVRQRQPQVVEPSEEEDDMDDAEIAALIRQLAEGSPLEDDEEDGDDYDAF
jgi:hypothetical protein